MKSLKFSAAILVAGILLFSGVIHSWAQTISGMASIQEATQSGKKVRVIVRLKQSSETTLEGARSAFSSTMSAAGVQNAQAIKGSDLMVLTINEQERQALEASGQVTQVFEDKPYPPALFISVPHIQGDKVWDLGFTGDGQTIAILDSGVDSSHPFLQNKVVKEACFSSTDPDEGSASVCPNGQDEQIGSGAGVPCPDSNLVACEHGTHVAGIAAGKGSDFSGVAKDAKIISIQVFSKFTDQPGGPSNCQESDRPSPCMLTFPSDQIKALEHVRELANTMEISSANLSLGGSKFVSHCDFHPMKDSIDELRGLDIATIIASGNEFHTDGVGVPSCISTAISVGATTKFVDSVAEFSNSSPLIDLLAPGTNMRSSIPGGQFLNKDGTSMATPMVAGAWAVLMSQKPSAKVSEIEQVLKSTGTPVNDNRNNVTKPRIDILKASQAIGGNINTADMSLELKGSPSQVSPGQDVAYTYTIKNVGTKEGSARLVSTIPPEIEFKSVSIGSCKDTPQNVACEVFTIQPQAQKEVIMNFTVKQTSATQINHKAELLSHQNDPNLENNKASIQTAVVSTPGPNDPICASPDINITDNDTNGVSSVVNVANSSSASNLKVKLEVDHSWVGDLKATLEHVPTNTVITLLDRPGLASTAFGCDKNNIDVTFDDSTSEEANSACDTPTAISGDLKPVGTLSTFSGIDTSGEWKLNIADLDATETGKLKKWCLEMEKSGDLPQVAIAPAPTKGNIQSADQEDKYEFTIQQQGDYQVVVTGNPQVQVSVSSKDNPDSPVASGNNQTLISALGAGVYHLTVTPKDNQQTGDYQLQVHSLSKSGTSVAGLSPAAGQ